MLLPVRLPNSVQDDETMSLWEADGLGDCHSIARNVTIGIGNAGPMESVLSLFRVASAQQGELSTMKANFMEREERTDQCEDGLVPQLGATVCRMPFSVPNEIRALHLLQEATRAALGRYLTTFEQDSDMLLSSRRTWEILNRRMKPSPVSLLQSIWRTKSLSSRRKKKRDATPDDDDSESQWRHAVTVRREEKKILRHYFQLASIGLNFLEYYSSDSDGECDNAEYFETYKGMLEASLQDQEPFRVM